MKKLSLCLLLLFVLGASAQNYPKDWHLNYSEKDTAMGINLYAAMKNTPAPATAKTTIVAVIDGGTDIKHQDLAAHVWINTKEIAGNAVDDDHNGYIDDINGWDFIGSLSQDVQYDNLELTRLVRDGQKRFGNKTSKEIPKSEKADYKRFKELETIFYKKRASAVMLSDRVSTTRKYVKSLADELDSTNISLEKLEKYEPKSPEAKAALPFVVGNCKALQMTPEKFFDLIERQYEEVKAQVDYQLNLEYDPRNIVGDNYLDPKDIKYGNNEVKGPDAMHGTHVAGIIGAVRDNNIGMNGICPNVQLMVLRVVPDGDERDKDVANAIRYAADNGARVINMSFGKGFVFNRKIVEEAIRYAESKDVLMVHGAGNENADNDNEPNFPTPVYEDGTICKTWIEVGASDRDQTPAPFSNYGRKTVNVFAPGVQIYSTVPDNKYEPLDGTSMASPVVAGLAALIRSYYPNLTAAQVKQAIESSVVKPTKKVKKPGKRRKKTKYKKLCTSAGIINADAALKAAAAMK